jgi:hypothetical protein
MGRACHRGRADFRDRAPPLLRSRATLPEARILWRVSIGERLEHVAVLDSGEVSLLSEAVAFVVPDVFVAGITFGRGAIGETGKQIGDQ